MSGRGQAKSLDAARLTHMFPFPESFKAASAMKGSLQVYGPTFLNPWIRFHWLDLLDTTQSRCEPQFAAIAFNDSFRKTTLHLVGPDSMLDYLKWLSAFVEPAGQQNLQVITETRPTRKTASGGRR
jgi:hypothetical protein